EGPDIGTAALLKRQLGKLDFSKIDGSCLFNEGGICEHQPGDALVDRAPTGLILRCAILRKYRRCRRQCEQQAQDELLHGRSPFPTIISAGSAPCRAVISSNLFRASIAPTAAGNISNSLVHSPGQ